MAAVPPGGGPNGGFVNFDDLAEELQNMGAQLTALGIQNLPDLPAPDDREGMRAYIQACLELVKGQIADFRGGAPLDLDQIEAVVQRIQTLIALL